MKRNSIFIGLPALTACLMLLSGCTAEETDVQSIVGNGKEIRMTASMQQMTRTASDLQNTQLSQNVTVGVCGVSDGNTISNGDNAGYTADDIGNLIASGNTMNWPAVGTVSIYAYAPRQEGWNYSTDPQTFMVATDQSTDTGYLASDLIWASASPTSQQTVNLGFSHKLSRIQLTVATDANTSLTDAMVRIVNTKTSAPFTLTTGEVGTAVGDATAITIGSGITLTANSSATLYSILIPQTVSAGTTLIEVTAGGKVWKYHFADAKTLAGGKSHSLNVVVSTSKVTSTISGEASEPAN